MVFAGRCSQIDPTEPESSFLPCIASCIPWSASVRSMYEGQSRRGLGSPRWLGVHRPSQFTCRDVVIGREVLRVPAIKTTCVAMEASTRSRRVVPNASLYLNGKSPRERAIEKQQKVLRWIHAWGFSAAEEIRRISGQEARGYATRLAKAGLLASTRTEAGGVVSGVPREYYTLSSLGLAEAERQTAYQFRYPELDPYRVNQRTLRHNLLAQRLTLNAMHEGRIAGCLTERQWATLPSRPRYKRPDVLWKDPAGDVIGVEVELTGKWDRDLDEFVDGVVTELTMSGIHARTLQKFLIATDAKALAARYRKALSPGAGYRTWIKDQRGHWRPEKELTVPDWIDDLVEVRLLDA